MLGDENPTELELNLEIKPIYLQPEFKENSTTLNTALMYVGIPGQRIFQERTFKVGGSSGHSAAPFMH